MKIIYMVTDICNANCLHCYKNRSKLIARDITKCEEDVKTLITQGNQVVIAGAETLTDRRYLKIYELVGQQYIISNGILLAEKPKTCKELISCGIREIRISWHIGFQNVLNSINENTIKRAIANCLKVGLRVVIACVISNRNYEMISTEICEKVINSGAKILWLIQLLPTIEELKKYQLNERQKMAVFDQVIKLRRLYHRDNLYIMVHPCFSANLTNKSREAIQCGGFCPAGRALYVIETNDEVYPCPFLTKPRFQSGLWKNGQLIINKELPNDGKSCLAEKIWINKNSLGR